MLEVTVRADARYKALAAQLREAGDRGLSRTATKGVLEAAEPATDRVVREIPLYMPSGYAPTLAGAMRFKVARRATGVTIKAHADGKSERRDVDALENRGRLRHPLYGRRKKRHSPGKGRSLFYTTSVLPRFFSGPLQRSAPEVAQAIVANLEKLAARIGG